MGPLLKQLVLESLTLPKTAATRLLNISLAPGEILHLAVVVAILYTLTLSALLVTYQNVEGMEFPEIGPLRPILSAVLQVAQLYFVAICIQRFGQMFGGFGTMDGALKVTIFMGFVSTLWLAVILASMYVSVPLATLFTLAFVYWTFWALASFISVLHGFQSVLNTFVGVIVFGLLIVLILLIVSGIILNATGMVPTGAV